YTCVATNKAGTVSRDFFVQGIQPPKIALPEEEAKKATSVVETFEGNSITLECPVTAPLDSVEIEWHKMGKKITESSKYSISLDRQRLVIVNARRGDDSAFSCHVRNMAGEASRSFEMKVLVPPRIEGEPVDNVELVEGEELDLQCIYDGVPTPTVVWTKNRLKLPEHIQVLNEKRFVYVEQVTAEDAGSYRCFAENVAGKAEKTFEVSVVVKPHIEGAHVVTEVEARVSHTANLHCPVADGRNVQVTWTKDGVPLSELELA
ncbi:HIM-4 protein, partial [Aphelenchoides avenae]